MLQNYTHNLEGAVGYLVHSESTRGLPVFELDLLVHSLVINLVGLNSCLWYVCIGTQPHMLSEDALEGG